MRWAHDNVKNSGLFDRDCEKWRKKPQAEKNWTSFQNFFLEADDDRKKNTLTATEATYTAKQVQEILQNKIETILRASDTPPDDPTSHPVPQTSTPTANANANMTTEDIRRIVIETLSPILLAPPTRVVRPTVHETMAQAHHVTYPLWAKQS